MKKTHVICILFIGVCITSLFFCRDQWRLYGREWVSFQRHFVYKNRHRIYLRQPLLSRSVAKQDPEAAAIVELIYRETTDDFEDVKYLSEQAISYPDNPYFLYDLACRLASRAYVDPQIIDRIADRLLQIDPANSRYYLLKAWACFYDWGDDRPEMALEYLEKCFSGSGHQDPYDRYRGRVCDLIEKERLTFLIADWGADWHSNMETFLLSQLNRDMLAYTQDLIVNSRIERAMRIHDRLQLLAQTSIPPKTETPWEFWLSFDSGMMMLSPPPQMVELKWMNSDPQRARQNRLQMLGWRRFNEQRWSSLRTSQGLPEKNFFQSEDWAQLRNHTVPISAHSFQVIIAAVAAMCFFLGVGIMLGMRKISLSRWSVAGIILFSLVYFIICRWGDYGLMHVSGMCNHYSFASVPVSGDVFSFLRECKPYARYVVWGSVPTLVVCSLIFLKKQKMPGIGGRILIRILAVLFIFSLWLTFSSLQFATLVLDLLLWLVLIPLFYFGLRNIRTRDYHNLFERSLEGMQFRAGCVMLSGVVLLLHLVVFSLFARPLSAMMRDAQQNSQRFHRKPTPLPRYTSDPNLYPSFLSQFQTEEPWKIDLTRWLVMVEPADIPAVLTTLKQRREKDPNYYHSPYWQSIMTGPGIGLSPRPQTKPKRYFPDLPYAMETCGRDALPAMIPFLEGPETTPMLIIRGRAKDVSARKRLVELWEKHRDAGFPESHWSMSEEADSVEPIPLEALVGICPYSQVKEYILEYSQWGSLHERRLLLDRNWMEYFTRQEKGDLIEELIPIMKESPPRLDDALNVLQYNAELKPAATQWLWEQLIEEFDHERDFRDWLDLRSKPADHHLSDELIMKCLSSEYDQLRAMGQHIYRKLEKPLDEQIVHRWAQDSNFTIRAAAALHNPACIRSDDPDPFVRLIRELAEE